VSVLMLVLAWLVQRFVERPLAGHVRAILLGGLAAIDGRGRRGSASPSEAKEEAGPGASGVASDQTGAALPRGQCPEIADAEARPA